MGSTKFDARIEAFAKELRSIPKEDLLVMKGMLLIRLLKKMAGREQANTRRFEFVAMGKPLVIGEVREQS